MNRTLVDLITKSLFPPLRILLFMRWSFLIFENNYEQPRTNSWMKKFHRSHTAIFFFPRQWIYYFSWILQPYNNINHLHHWVFRHLHRSDFHGSDRVFRQKPPSNWLKKATLGSYLFLFSFCSLCTLLQIFAKCVFAVVISLHASIWI